LTVFSPSTPSARSDVLSSMACRTLATLIPLALRGVKFVPSGAAQLLRRNLLIYGAGGVIAPFIWIKLIDILLTALGVK